MLLDKIIKRGLITATVLATLVSATLTQAQTQEKFSMVIMSDSQVPDRWRNGRDESCSDEDCIKRKTKEANQDMAAAIKDIKLLGHWSAHAIIQDSAPPDDFPSFKMISNGEDIITPNRVILNGDITEFWKAGETKDFNEIYNSLGVPIYYGLGNHDYANNYDTKNDSTCKTQLDHNQNLPLSIDDDARCAKSAVAWMADRISGYADVSNHDVPTYVAAYNESGFTFDLEVTYLIDGKRIHDTDCDDDPVISRCDNGIGAGNWGTVLVPKNATNVEAYVDAWWGERVGPFPVVSGATCYRISGTTQNVGHRKHSCFDARALPPGGSGSLSYSFDVGSYHFVQLHNYPAYAVNLPSGGLPPLFDAYGFNVTTSHSWLKADLQDATMSGKRSVINMHDWGEAKNDPLFKAAIKDQNVVAIFAGHAHQVAGRHTKVDNNIRDIPVFLSGSAECRTLLYVDFESHHFNVGVIDVTDARNSIAPRFITRTECDPVNHLNAKGEPIDFDRNYKNVLGSYSSNTPPMELKVTVDPESPEFEGTLTQFSAQADDWDGDTLTYTWAFGDGQSEDGQSVEHAYGDQGTFTGTVKADDGNGGVTTKEFSVEVMKNEPPVVTANGAVIDENGKATVKGTIFDPGFSDTFTVDINWRDGTQVSYPYPAGTTMYSEAHQYLDDNPSGTAKDIKKVVVTVTDKDGGEGVSQADVTVNNEAPTAAIDSITDQAGNVFGQDVDIILAGLQFRIAASFSDVGTLDTHVMTIDWGDGSSTAVHGDATSPVNDAHTYRQPGDYRIDVTVTDDDTGSRTTSATINVVDAAGAVSNVSEKLSLLATDPAIDPEVVKLIREAVDKLIGDDGGLDENGALDQLEISNAQAALVKLSQAIELLIETNSSLHTGTSPLISQLVLTAKAVVINLLDNARESATTSRELRKITMAEEYVASGDERFHNGDYGDAVVSYSRALTKL